MTKSAKNRRRVISIIQVVLVVVALGGGGWLAYKYLSYRSAASVYEGLKSSAVGADGAATVAEAATIDDAAGDTGSATVDFDTLSKKCPDLVGWIHIDDVDLDFPVVQGTDNEHYLTYDATGSQSAYGAVFMDCRNKSLADDLHVLVYGHNMIGGGMLSPLTQYTEQSFFANGTGTFWIATPEATYHYQIFAVSVVEPDDAIYTVGYENTEVFDEFVQTIKSKSLYDTGVDVSGQDRVLTISTCSRPNRLVISAKLVQAS